MSKEKITKDNTKEQKVEEVKKKKKFKIKKKEKRVVLNGKAYVNFFGEHC